MISRQESFRSMVAGTALLGRARAIRADRFPLSIKMRLLIWKQISRKVGFWPPKPQG